MWRQGGFAAHARVSVSPPDANSQDHDLFRPPSAREIAEATAEALGDGGRVGTAVVGSEGGEAAASNTREALDEEPSLRRPVRVDVSSRQRIAAVSGVHRELGAAYGGCFLCDLESLSESLSFCSVIDGKGTAGEERAGDSPQSASPALGAELTTLGGKLLSHFTKETPAKSSPQPLGPSTVHEPKATPGATPGATSGVRPSPADVLFAHPLRMPLYHAVDSPSKKGPKVVEAGVLSPSNRNRRQFFVPILRWNMHDSHVNWLAGAVGKEVFIMCVDESDFSATVDHWMRGGTHSGRNLRHSGTILDVRWSPLESQRLLTSDDSGTIFIWDVQSAERGPVGRFEVPEPAAVLAWHPENPNVFCVTSGAAVVFFDARMGVSHNTHGNSVPSSSVSAPQTSGLGTLSKMLRFNRSHGNPAAEPRESLPGGNSSLVQAGGVILRIEPHAPSMVAHLEWSPDSAAASAGVSKGDTNTCELITAGDDGRVCFWTVSVNRKSLRTRIVQSRIFCANTALAGDLSDSFGDSNAGYASETRRRRSSSVAPLIKDAEAINLGGHIDWISYVPFGHGLISLIKGETCVKLWSARDLTSPLRLYCLNPPNAVESRFNVITLPCVWFRQSSVPARTRGLWSSSKSIWQLFVLSGDGRLHTWTVDDECISSLTCSTSDFSTARLRSSSLSTAVGEFSSLSDTSQPRGMIRSRSSTTMAHAQTLEDEFVAVEQFGIPGVSVRSIDRRNREIAVAIKDPMSSLEAHIVVSFPDDYPTEAPPSFAFVEPPGSHDQISVDAQATLRSFLMETAALRARNRLPSLYFCLSKVVLLLHAVGIRSLSQHKPESTFAASGTIGIAVPRAERGFDRPGVSQILHDLRVAGTPDMMVLRDRIAKSRSADLVEYVVTPTDTVIGICMAHGMSKNELKRANPLLTDRVFAGQVIKVKSIAGSSESDELPMLEYPAAGLRMPTMRPVSLNAGTRSLSAMIRSSREAQERERQTRIDRGLSSHSNSVQVMREHCQFCIPLDDDLLDFKNGGPARVHGQLTLTSQVIVFEPSLNDPIVALRGVLPFQLWIPLEDVFDCVICEPCARHGYEFVLEVSFVGAVREFTLPKAKPSLTMEGEITARQLEFVMQERSVRSTHKVLVNWVSAAQTLAGNAADETAAPAVSPRNGDIVDRGLRHSLSDLRELTTNVVLPRLMASSQLLPEPLKERVFDLLLPYLTPSVRMRDWKLVYGTLTHGISLASFYRECEAYGGPSLLIVGATDGSVFGCFATEPWHVDQRFYGSGECFVFKLSPEVEAKVWTWGSERQAPQHFQCSRRDFVAMGGGVDGSFALWLDADLQNGSSFHCLTFGSDEQGSPPLTSSEDFIVTHLEVWGFV